MRKRCVPRAPHVQTPTLHLKGPLGGLVSKGGGGSEWS